MAGSPGRYALFTNPRRELIHYLGEEEAGPEPQAGRAASRGPRWGPSRAFLGAWGHGSTWLGQCVSLGLWSHARVSCQSLSLKWEGKICCSYKQGRLVFELLLNPTSDWPLKETAVGVLFTHEAGTWLLLTVLALGAQSIFWKVWRQTLATSYPEHWDPLTSKVLGGAGPFEERLFKEHTRTHSLCRKWEKVGDFGQATWPLWALVPRMSHGDEDQCIRWL